MYPNEDDMNLALEVIKKYGKKINKLFNSADESDREILLKGLAGDGSPLKARFSFMFQVLADVVTQEITCTFDKKEWTKLISLFKKTVDVRFEVIKLEDNDSK